MGDKRVLEDDSKPVVALKALIRVS